MAKDVIVPLKMQSIDVSGIAAGAFSAMGDPLEGALAFIRITNSSNVAVFISYNGLVDHEYIPAGGKMEHYFMVDLIPNVALLRKGKVIYVRGNAGVGSVYLSGYYNE